MIAGVFLVLYSTLSNLFPQIGFIFSLVLFAAVPWIMVRALAFNARNSALRTIRFGFSGRVKDAAKAFVLWPILVPLTLGILAPYAYYRQRKFIVENSSYGTTRFALTATARDYYRLFLSASVPLIIGVGLFAAVIFFLPPLAVPVALALYLYLFAFYSVKTTNLTVQFIPTGRASVQGQPENQRIPCAGGHQFPGNGPDVRSVLPMGQNSHPAL